MDFELESGASKAINPITIDMDMINAQCKRSWLQNLGTYAYEVPVAALAGVALHPSKWTALGGALIGSLDAGAGNYMMEQECKMKLVEEAWGKVNPSDSSKKKK